MVTLHPTIFHHLPQSTRYRGSHERSRYIQELSFLFFLHHFLLSSSQRQSRQNRGHTCVFPSPLRYVPSFLSRTGFSIPTVQFVMFVDFHRNLVSHARALSASQYDGTQEKSAYVRARRCPREDSNQHTDVIDVSTKKITHQGYYTGASWVTD